MKTLAILISVTFCASSLAGTQLTKEEVAAIKTVDPGDIRGLAEGAVVRIRATKCGQVQEINGPCTRLQGKGGALVYVPKEGVERITRSAGRSASSLVFFARIVATPKGTLQYQFTGATHAELLGVNLRVGMTEATVDW